MPSRARRALLRVATTGGMAFCLLVFAPAPVSTATTVAAPQVLRVGAYYYAWYGSDGRHWQDGYLRRKLSIAQTPALGEYDSRAAATIESHFGWAQQYGIDFFVCSWWGAGNYEDVTIRDHLLPSAAAGGTRIAILYESISLLGTTGGVVSFDGAAEAKLISDFDYLARTYFASDRYLKVDGKPVVYLYVSRIYRGNYARAFASLRSYIRGHYGYDLYLVGDEVDWDGTPDATRIRTFDAITAYTMYSDLQPPGWPDDTGFLAGVRARYDLFRSVAAAEGVGFVPSVLPAFNDRGVRLAANHYALPHEVNGTHAEEFTLFAGFLQLSGEYVDPTLPTLVVTSWNEWHEDTQIEPTAAALPSFTPPDYTEGYSYYSYGFRLLELLRSFKDAYAPPPTVIALNWFVATRTDVGVRLHWRTTSETSTLGFNLYRRDNKTSVKLNRTLIPSVFGGTTRGHGYSWLDDDAPTGRALRYRLQAVSLDGRRKWVAGASLDRGIHGQRP